jgi:hypothetical protein
MARKDHLPGSYRPVAALDHAYTDIASNGRSHADRVELTGAAWRWAVAVATSRQNLASLQLPQSFDIDIR